MTSSNSGPPGPPLWAIRLCKWLWRVQGRFWRLIFGGFVAEVLINIIINLIANVSLASQPLGVLQQAALINLMLQHAAITFTIVIIVAAFEFVIYFGSHIPLPTTKVAAPLSFPVPKRFLPPWWQKALSWILSALLVATIAIWAGAAILHKTPPAPDNGLLFSAFSYPDEWSLQHLQQPAFISDYWQTFDPDKQHAGNPYTYSRAGSDTILAYDALSLFTSASDIVLFKEKLTLTPQILWAALNQFTPDNMLMGVSGQVSFMGQAAPRIRKLSSSCLFSRGEPDPLRSKAVPIRAHLLATRGFQDDSRDFDIVGRLL